MKQNNSISKYGKPNTGSITLSMFARKNLIQAGFIAGMRFAGLDKEKLRDDPENTEKWEAMRQALMDVFESHGMTREIEF